MREISRGAFSAAVLKGRGEPAITAAGVDLTTVATSLTSQKNRKAQGWQELGWNYLDAVPEFYYGTTWVGNLLSKGRLRVLKDGDLTEDPNALNALASFFGGEDLHGEFFRQAGEHMTVAGGFYLISYGPDDNEQWRVIAETEMRTTPDGAGGKQWAVVDEPDLVPTSVLRVWRPHPRKHQWSNCATRPLLATLAELEMFTKYVHAQGDSRLTGNGILWLPKEMDFPAVQVTAADGSVSMQNGDETSFLKMLFDVASKAKKDPASAAARLPIPISVNAEFIEKIKHMTFWTEFDEKVPALREEARTTLATGMDMPPEVLKGTADMNHWSSWQMEEASIKAHTEPLLNFIVSAVTVGFLRPFLMSKIGGGMTEEEARRFRFDADSSLMRLRPNKSQESIELYDRGELTAVAMLRENGFDVSDAMSQEELKLWAAKMLLRSAGGTTPQQLAALGAIVGLPLPEENLTERVTDNISGPRENTPTLDGHPSQNPPVPIVASAAPHEAILIAAAHPLVYRALERTGNRMKTKFSVRPEGVPATELYRHLSLTPADVEDVLTGAFDGVAQAVAGLGIDSAALRRGLESYVRMLFATKGEHDPVVMKQFLALTAMNEAA